MKILVLTSGLLLLALGTYLYLAITLFSGDKLAYVYDLSASAAANLAAQTRAELELLAREGRLFAVQTEATPRPGGEDAFFARADDTLRVEVLDGVEPDGSYVGRRTYVHRALLEHMVLGEADLEHLDRERPIPLHAVVGQPEGIYVQNSSLPPQAGILTLAFLSEKPGQVIRMDIRHQRLLRIFSGSSRQVAMLIDENGDVLAHPDAAMVVERTALTNNPLVIAALESATPQGVKEFSDAQGATYLGAFSAVGAGRLWVLTHISRESALAANRELVRRSILFAVAVLLVAFVASVFFSRVLAAPIQTLRAATEALGTGSFDVRVEVEATDEIGDLANAFNRMAQTLRETQAQLVQSEKMAAFGQLGAGITHEIKNPMTGIVGFAQLAQRKLDDPKKVGELLQLIEREGLRCRDILVNFLKFTRTGQGERERQKLNDLVEQGTAMVRHQLNMQHVKIDLQLCEEQPEVRVNGPELQQVLLNLAINAQQAMPEGGRVRFETHCDERWAWVVVRDTGPGIPPHVRSRIFEPFYTTKPKGEGTGLGLSVSFSIVQAHGGVLELVEDQEPGAAFRICLPRLVA